MRRKAGEATYRETFAASEELEEDGSVGRFNL